MGIREERSAGKGRRCGVCEWRTRGGNNEVITLQGLLQTIRDIGAVRLVEDARVDVLE